MEENILYKKCSRCKEVKPLSEFTKYKKSKDKLNYYCRDCEREILKLWNERNKERMIEYRKIYYEKNRERIYKRNRLWHKNNEEKMKKYHKEYYKTHPGKLKK